MSNFTADPQDEYIFSVGELNENVRQLLEKNYGQVWVAGEISNFMQPTSGHMYFSLKDERGQIRAAYFRGRQRTLTFLPENGQQVIACGKLSLYPERGDYQLIIEHLLPSGEGALKQQFEALKEKLKREGLFLQEHKKPLPKQIKILGVITSASGAALQDVLSVLKRRWPMMQVIVYDSLVQGEQAPMQLIKALQFANQTNECDALLMTRGGGSLEDLWAFNDEHLAQAIFQSDLPIVSAVGHEVDFSISDFVADVRAPTPSAAAELLSPNQSDFMRALKDLEQKLFNEIEDRIQRYQEHLHHLSKRLKHPADTLNAQAQHLDHLALRLKQAIQFQISQNRSRIDALIQRLRHPAEKLNEQKQIIERLENQLRQSMQYRLSSEREHFARLAERLNTMSPLSTLQRGYALVQAQDHRVITSAEQVNLCDELEISLSKGKLSCQVTAVNKT